MNYEYKVNLLPDRLRQRNNIDYRRLGKILCITLLGGLIIGCYLAFLLKHSLNKSDLEDIKLQILTLEPLVCRVNEIRNERIAMEQAHWEYQLVLRNEIEISPILTGLGETAPANLWLTGMTVLRRNIKDKEQGGSLPPAIEQEKKSEAENALDDKTGKPGANTSLPFPNTILLSGYCSNVSYIGKFINNLGTLPYFEEVWLNRLTKDDKGFRFEVSTTLRNDP